MSRKAKKDDDRDPIYAPPTKKPEPAPIPPEQWQESFREFAAGDDPNRNVHLAAAAYLDAVRDSVADFLRSEGVTIDARGLPRFEDGHSWSCHPLGKASRKVTRAANVLAFLFGHTTLAAQRAFDAGRSYEMLRNAIHLEPLVRIGRNRRASQKVATDAKTEKNADARSERLEMIRDELKSMKHKNAAQACRNVQHDLSKRDIVVSVGALQRLWTRHGGK